MKRSMLFAIAAFLATPASGAEITRIFSVEVDPIAPAAAAVQSQEDDRAVSMYGGSVDFNLGHISTGPEVWIGTFLLNAKEDGLVRPEDLQPGERHKLDAVRLRWHVSLWEVSSTMRGWYLRAGFNYTKIQSKAKKFSTMTVNDSELYASDVVDLRQGAMIGFGQRWVFWKQKASLSIGMSYALDARRQVTVDSEDPNAEDDYNAIIEDIPDSRLSARPMPEAHFGFGYML